MSGQRRHEAPELGAAARRFLRALAVRATEGDTEAIEQLVQLQLDVQASLGAAIAGAREAKGYSWADIADLTGTTRQNAQQRFGGAKPPETFPCTDCGLLYGTQVQLSSHRVREHGEERCPKVTQPKPLRCELPVGHKESGVSHAHVMAADEPEPDTVADELTGASR